MLQLKRALALRSGPHRHSLQRLPKPVPRPRSIACMAKSISSKEAVTGLKAAMQGSVDPVYLEGANYLKTLGFSNTAEIARVLDIAMNPNSLFLAPHSASRNGLARPLSVNGDMDPVISFLQEQGLTGSQLVAAISAHPPVLCYDVEARLRPFFDYLRSIGVESPGAAVASRPSLLGLDVDNGLKKIVEYLQYTETPPDKIVEYITRSI